MKSNIHPKYFEKAQVICVCGAILETGSTKQEMHVEVCAHCHPFYTGKKKVMDTTGRVDRFKKLAEKSASLAKTHASKREKQTTRKATRKPKAVSEK